jgi:hypothetical protein
MAEAGPIEVAEKSKNVFLRRMLFAVLGVFLVVLVIIGAIYGPTFWRVYQQRDTTFSAPKQIGSLHLEESEGAQDTAEYVRAAAASAVDFETSLGAVYTDQGGESRSVIVVGGTATLWAPDPSLTKMFELIIDESGSVVGVSDVDTGPLGGIMRCGTTATPDGDMAVCGWADHGCIAVALFPNRTLDEASGLMREIRGAMESRK